MRRGQPTSAYVQNLEARRLLASAAGFFLDEVVPLPGKAVIADFNRDGRPDLASMDSDYAPTGVLVAINTGRGRFARPLFTSVPGIAAMVAGDVTGDGRADVVAVAGSADAAPDRVVVLRSLGDGSFAVQPAEQGGAVGTDLLLHDLTGDGTLDLAMLDRGTGMVSIKRGLGGGRFAPAKSIAVYRAYEYASGLTVGDFNADGKPELATTTPGIDAQIDVVFVRARSDGFPVISARRRASDAIFYNADQLLTADLDGDHRDDLLLTESDEYGSGANGGFATTELLLNRGDWKFVATKPFDESSSDYEPSSHAAAGDFNGDGRTDLAIGNSVLLSRGDGAFDTMKVQAVNGEAGYGPAISAGSIAGAADFTGDGKTDLLREAPNGVSIAAGRGDGTFVTPARMAVSSYGAITEAAALADFNRDGNLDLAATYGDGWWGPGAVFILQGRGDGTFHNARRYETAAGAYQLVVADFNRDGLADLATGNQVFDGQEWGSYSVSILIGRRDGTFAPARTFEAGYISSALSAGDVNGDGKMDLIAQEYDAITSEPILSVFRGRGDGSFAKAVTTPGYSPTLATADLNGDGRADRLGYIGDDGLLRVFAGQKDGTFRRGQPLATKSLSNSAVADVNGDARTDVLAMAEDGSLQLLLSRGGGAFAPMKRIGTGPFTGLIDINNDGRRDLITNNVTIQLANRDGTFGEPVIFAGGQPTLAGDLNNDGRIDLVCLSRGGYFNVLLNRVPLPSGRGSLAGVVYNDRNRNGRQDAGEKGVAGFLIYADLNADGKLNHNEPRAISNTVGRYRLANLLAGRTLLRLQVPPGWQQTGPRGRGAAHWAEVFSDKVIGDWPFGVAAG